MTARQPPPRANDLADRIDPNTATTAELSAIPDLGPKRAQSIVDFRQKFIERHPNQIPFHHASDLEQIPGIGPATADNLALTCSSPRSRNNRPTPSKRFQQPLIIRVGPYEKPKNFVFHFPNSHSPI